jgi:hypothetical protein
MLNDADEWPVVCPECGQVTNKEIGWLKENSRFNCDKCGIGLRYYKDAFVHELEQTRRTLNALARATRFVQKEK